jgi:tripartite-type tricarboxylate transporter receptor subunit TctC
MNMLGKTTGALALAAFTATAMIAAVPTITPAIAGDYPDKTVRANLPFGADGGTDRWVRVMSSAGFDVFENGMRVENRSGASGTVGWKAMLAKPADGHTLLMASPTPVIAALLEKKPPFDPANARIVAYYSIMKPTLVAPKGRLFSTWQGLVEHLKAGGKKVTIGGTITQALGAASLLAQVNLVDKVTLVPYSGTGKAVNDFLGGHIDMVMVTTSTALSLAGKNAIVVNASDLEYPKKAKKTLGDVPNAKTLGLTPYNPPRFVAMHPDTPDAQVSAMSAKLGDLLGQKSVKKLIGKLGEVIIYLPADKAQAAYNDVLEGAKANLKYFQ